MIWARQGNSTNRVIRGGAWNNSTTNLRCGNRNHNGPSNTNTNDGFRCMRRIRECVRVLQAERGQPRLPAASDSKAHLPPPVSAARGNELGKSAGAGSRKANALARVLLCATALLCLLVRPLLAASGSAVSPAFVLNTGTSLSTGSAISAPFALNTRSPYSTSAAVSRAFVLELRLPPGQSRSRASSGFTLDTRSELPITLLVSGPPTVTPADSQGYTCTAYYPTQPPENVTARAVWSITGGPVGTEIAWGVVTAGRGPGGSARITASLALPAGGRRTSPPLAVTIGPALRVALSPPVVTEQSRSGQAFQWRIRTTATVLGAPGAQPTFAWSGHNLPPFTAPPTAALDTVVAGTARSGRVVVTVVDALSGGSGTAEVAVMLNKTPAAQEAIPRQTSGDVEEGHYLNAAGDSFPYNDTAARNIGLTVITHGLLLNDDTAGQLAWMKNMAGKIGPRIDQEMGAGKQPYILLYDWLHDARASNDYLDEESKRVADELVVRTMRNTGPGAIGSAAISRMAAEIYDQFIAGDRFDPNARYDSNLAFAFGGFFNATAAVREEIDKKRQEVRKFLANVILSRQRGRDHGTFLAERLWEKVVQGRLSNGKPLHLIGHSAGGFVVGQCARELKQRLGYTGEILVTMLDTPFPWIDHHPKASSGMRLERYISSVIGGRLGAPVWDATSTVYVPTRYEPGSGASYLTSLSVVMKKQDVFKVAPSCIYHRYDLPRSKSWRRFVDDHSEAHRWYTGTISPGEEDSGFYHSPFIGNHPWDCQTSSTSAAMASSAPPAPPSQHPLGPFQSYGTVSTDSGAYVLTEADNAGLFVETTLPDGASKLVFEYQFTGAGDGDFLQVFIDAGLPLLEIPAGTVSQPGYGSAEVDVSASAGRTVRLDFRLVSRGSPNAVLRLRNFWWDVEADLDGDGVSNATELANGTNPWLIDSDADGLSDHYESVIASTDPLLADTDGDGADDAEELLAGSDPVNAWSHLRIQSASRSPGGEITLRWRGVVGQMYQVQRSQTVDFADFDVVASGLVGVATVTVFTDSSAAPVTSGRLFYRLATQRAVTAEGADGDADGLGGVQEAAAGSNSALYDTDGDGLSDGEEVLVLGTSPIRRDTDGDGSGDWEELVAGTNPTNPNSILAITGIHRNADGSVTLQWSGVVGRTYRVLRSGSPSFGHPEVIATGRPGIAPTTSYTDATAASAAAFFYRVAVE